MDYLGFIAAGGLDEKRWTQVVADHRALAPIEAHSGVNPFTGKKKEFRSDPRGAQVQIDGRVVGEMRLWRHTIQVMGEDAEDGGIANDVAAALGGTFHAWDAEAPAKGVPEPLHGLLSRSADDRHEAHAQLHSLLCPIDAVLDDAEGGAELFSHLVTLLARDHVPDRDHVVGLIASIVESADGDSELMTRVRQASVEAIEDLVELLDHPIDPLRGDAARALGRYPERADSLIPVLKGALARERDEDVSHDIERSLRMLQGEDVEEQERRAREDEDATKRRARAQSESRTRMLTVGFWFVCGAVIWLVTGNWLPAVILWALSLLVLLLATRRKSKGAD